MRKIRSVNELGWRQRKILEHILETVEQRGYPPSVREIGEAVGLSSPSTVHTHLKSLQGKGYLEIDPSKPRAITVSYAKGIGPSKVRAEVKHVPLIGRVAAGGPTLAAEEFEEVVAVPIQIASDGNFLLRIKGDSMIDAGIHDGDLVVVKEQPIARNGDVVIALLGEDATCKVYAERNGKVIFESRNPEYADVVPTKGDTKILGKVVGLMRSL